MSMGLPFISIPKKCDLKKSQTVDELSASIRAVQADKNKLKPLVTQKIKAIRLEQDYMTRPKKHFSHPKLNIVFGQLVNSPYLTKPLDKYPKATFEIAEKIMDLKATGKTADKDLPFDTKEIKNEFIHGVMNYRPTYGDKKYQVSDDYISMYGVKATSRDFSNGLNPVPSEASIIALDQHEKAVARRNDAGRSGKKGKSKVMMAASGRGGPAKYRKKLKALDRNKYSKCQNGEERVFGESGPNFSISSPGLQPALIDTSNIDYTQFGFEIDNQDEKVEEQAEQEEDEGYGDDAADDFEEDKVVKNAPDTIVTKYDNEDEKEFADDIPVIAKDDYEYEQEFEHKIPVATKDDYGDENEFEDEVPVKDDYGDEKEFEDEIPVATKDDYGDEKEFEDEIPVAVKDDYEKEFEDEKNLSLTLGANSASCESSDVEYENEIDLDLRHGFDASKTSDKPPSDKNPAILPYTNDDFEL